MEQPNVLNTVLLWHNWEIIGGGASSLLFLALTCSLTVENNSLHFTIVVVIISMWFVLSTDEAYVSEDEFACSEDELGSTDAECSLAESGYGGTQSPGLSQESRLEESLCNTEYGCDPLLCTGAPALMTCVELTLSSASLTMEVKRSLKETAEILCIMFLYFFKIPNQLRIMFSHVECSCHNHCQCSEQSL